MFTQEEAEIIDQFLEAYWDGIVWNDAVKARIKDQFDYLRDCTENLYTCSHTTKMIGGLTMSKIDKGLTKEEVIEFVTNNLDKQYRIEVKLQE